VGGFLEDSREGGAKGEVGLENGFQRRRLSDITDLRLGTRPVIFPLGRFPLACAKNTMLELGEVAAFDHLGPKEGAED